VDRSNGDWVVKARGGYREGKWDWAISGISRTDVGDWVVNIHWHAIPLGA